MSESLYREVVKQMGVEMQTDMVAEEVGEMLSALSKFKRGRVRPMELAGEIADVRIMLDQIGHIVEELTAGTVTADNFEAWCEENRRAKMERLCGMLGIKQGAHDTVQARP